VRARATRAQNRAGAIHPAQGAPAGNPLENISDTRRIRVVVARGRVYDPAPLWRSVGFTP